MVKKYYYGLDSMRGTDKKLPRYITEYANYLYRTVPYDGDRLEISTIMVCLENGMVTLAEAMVELSKYHNLLEQYERGELL